MSRKKIKSFCALNVSAAQQKYQKTFITKQAVDLSNTNLISFIYRIGTRVNDQLLRFQVPDLAFIDMASNGEITILSGSPCLKPRPFFLVNATVLIMAIVGR